MLLCRYFVDVVKVRNQLTLNKGDDPQLPGWAWSNQLKGLNYRAYNFPVKEEIPPWKCTVPLLTPILRATDLTCQPHNHLSQVFVVNPSTHTHPLLVLLFWLNPD